MVVLRSFKLVSSAVRVAHGLSYSRVDDDRLVVVSVYVESRMSVVRCHQNQFVFKISYLQVW